ncbi:hypothetical protein QJS10_CPA05g01906 [Acorus calamus]|uniref:Uncharacterized protein n=1 Tax=Acorus calamus TaxID=4465 RepID=A0AAV9EW00_ACOCL|nr:hypothetical protein QJS10_CPA05g01906 [Acorus calamus]
MVKPLWLEDDIRRASCARVWINTLVGDEKKVVHVRTNEKRDRVVGAEARERSYEGEKTGGCCHCRDCGGGGEDKTSQPSNQCSLLILYQSNKSTDQTVLNPCPCCPSSATLAV